ncbi:MAG TPA: tetratricopeptide repeat protein [Myxococcales bacterium]|nr:tetratricopeptide repeat protein [Myxococcales bacterium]
MRFWQPILALALCASCAGGQVREDPALLELKGQLAVQAAQLQAQQRRIEELEVKLAAVSAHADTRRAVAPADKAAPSTVAAPARDPRPHLKTVKLGEGRRHRRDYNPVENAPNIPSAIALKEPDAETLQRLEEAAAIDPGVRDELDADHAFAQAVAKLNGGELQTAETQLLAFAGQHPRHTAADNALYLAGLIREHNGDCTGAIALFDRIPLTYPAGDAVLPSMVEKGRCLIRLKRTREARELFARIVREHPNGLEGESARQLLTNLDVESGRQ